jgi:uncharacterized iron-regulated protein
MRQTSKSSGRSSHPIYEKENISRSGIEEIKKFSQNTKESLASNLELLDPNTLYQNSRLEREGSHSHSLNDNEKLYKCSTKKIKKKLKRL